MKISGLSGVNNSSDDSVMMISYTTDPPSSYHTKNIRKQDLIDDNKFDQLPHTNIGTLASGDLLQWDGSQWISVSGASGSFTTVDSKTVTVTNGIITAIT